MATRSYGRPVVGVCPVERILYALARTPPLYEDNVSTSLVQALVQALVLAYETVPLLRGRQR